MTYHAHYRVKDRHFSYDDVADAIKHGDLKNGDKDENTYIFSAELSSQPGRVGVVVDPLENQIITVEHHTMTDD